MTFALDKMQIDDALGVNTYQMPAGAPNPGAPFGAPPMGAPQQPQPMATRFGGLSANMGAQAGPGHLQAGVGFGPQGQMQGANVGYAMPAAGGNLNLGANLDPRLRVAQLQAQYQRGPFNVGVGYQPHGAVSGNVGMRVPFQQGGLANYQSVQDFVHSRDQQMERMAGKQPYENGGFAAK